MVFNPIFLPVVNPWIIRLDLMKILIKELKVNYINKFWFDFSHILMDKYKSIFGQKIINESRVLWFIPSEYQILKWIKHLIARQINSGIPSPFWQNRSILQFYHFRYIKFWYIFHLKIWNLAETQNFFCLNIWHPLLFLLSSF